MDLLDCRRHFSLESFESNAATKVAEKEEEKIADTPVNFFGMMMMCYLKLDNTKQRTTNNHKK
jgi:hypothetical protein